MTDLDPLRQPPPEGSELPARAGRDERGHRPRPGTPLMEGPTGRAMTTESVGDSGRLSATDSAEIVDARPDAGSDRS